MDTITCTVARFVANTPSSFSCSLPTDDTTWDMLSAVGTVGATLVALLFGFFSHRHSKQEQKARRSQEEELASQAADERRAIIRSQAERVACWLEWEKVEPLPSGSNPKFLMYPRKEWSIVVQNASDQPIWEVGIFHWSLGTSKFTPIPVLAAGTTRKVPVRPKREEDGLTLEEPVDVRFRDNAGRNWYRPARVPGKLILEADSTFEDLENAEAPLLYRLPKLKALVENRWLPYLKGLVDNRWPTKASRSDGSKVIGETTGASSSFNS